LPVGPLADPSRRVSETLVASKLPPAARLGTSRFNGWTAMMRTPDGHSRLELSRYLTPPPVADHRNAPVNARGDLRVMFAVDDIDDTLTRLREHGAQLVGEVV
jgi:hypothetical protein